MMVSVSVGGTGNARSMAKKMNERLKEKMLLLEESNKAKRDSDQVYLEENTPKSDPPKIEI